MSKSTESNREENRMREPGAGAAGGMVGKNDHYPVQSMEEKPDGEGHETAGAYYAVPGGKKKQGEYTLEDYLALPEEERWELIDGHLIRMDSPTTEHQVISGELHVAFYNCIKEHGVPCKVLAAPVDVQLDMDDRTIVEPDLLILCDLEKLRRKRVFGAPDLLVEILSPSTQSRDMVWKNRKYQRAGVREYWMVDPDGRKIIVNIFDSREGEFRSRIYDFEETIPVGISNGSCRIDFAPIGLELDALYGEKEQEKKE